MGFLAQKKKREKEEKRKKKLRGKKRRKKRKNRSRTTLSFIDSSFGKDGVGKFEIVISYHVFMVRLINEGILSYFKTS